jgi:hypothetical protein
MKNFFTVALSIASAVTVAYFMGHKYDVSMSVTKPDGTVYSFGTSPAKPPVSEHPATADPNPPDSAPPIAAPTPATAFANAERDEELRMLEAAGMEMRSSKPSAASRNAEEVRAKSGSTEQPNVASHRARGGESDRSRPQVARTGKPDRSGYTHWGKRHDELAMTPRSVSGRRQAGNHVHRGAPAQCKC